MRIAVNLGVKDEVEIIERAIAHLRSIGVDLIIACDMCSTDGSAEILAEYRSRDDFWFFQMSELEGLQSWTEKNVTLAKRSGADWVLFLDADEFPIPASDRLKDCAALQNGDVISLARYNLTLGPAGPSLPDTVAPERYDELLLIAEPIHDYWTHIQTHPDTPWVMQPLCPRVIARPEMIETLTPGAHDAIPPRGMFPRRSRASDLIIAHLPFTTRSRFRRKAENLRKFYQMHDKYFDADSARHWRRWATLAEQDRIDEEFDRMVFGEARLGDLRRRRVIRSAAEILSAPVNEAQRQEATR